MMNLTIMQKLADIIETYLGVTIDNLDVTLSNLDCDDLDLLELEEAIEECFNIELPLDENYSIINIYDMIITKKKASQSKKQVTQEKPENHNKRWLVEEEIELLQMYAAGAQLDIISKILGRTVVSVLHRLAENNVVYYDKDSNAYYTKPTLLYKF